MSLEPIDPDTALELYLANRENEVAKATLYSHRSRLGHFIRWCGEKQITNLNSLTGRQLHEFRLWRRDEGDLAPATEKTQLDTLRVFVKWLESIDGVEADLHSKVRSPTLTGNDNIRDVMLDNERATEILCYLGKYEYASRPHIVLSLMIHTAMRVGAVRALDLCDFDFENESLEVVHRPTTETPIKNGEEGERFIAISSELVSLLDDWIGAKRPDVTDDHDRHPLITTAKGRAHTTTLRGDTYRYTRPCIIDEGCPHGRNESECEGFVPDQAYECPSSVSPHALRRGGITHHLSNNWPMKAVSDRANVSERVLEMHYDNRSEVKKMNQRRRYLDNL